MMAQFPSKEIAKLSYEYRTLGLGYANLGGYLMSKGVAYDSEEGRANCAAITALMTGISYATSAEVASEQGPFPGVGHAHLVHAGKQRVARSKTQRHLTG